MLIWLCFLPNQQPGQQQCCNPAGPACDGQHTKARLCCCCCCRQSACVPDGFRTCARTSRLLRLQTVRTAHPIVGQESRRLVDQVALLLHIGPHHGALADGLQAAALAFLRGGCRNAAGTQARTKAAAQQAAAAGSSRRKQSEAGCGRGRQQAGNMTSSTHR